MLRNIFNEDTNINYVKHENKNIKNCSDLLVKPPNEKQKSNFVGLKNQGATC